MDEKITRAVDMMIRTEKMRRTLFDGIVKEIGIHRTQHRMLMHISRCGTLTSQKALAELLGITPAAVNKTLDRANEKIERVLSYVVMYQQRVEDCSLTPVVVARAKVIAAAKNSPAENFGQRLVQLRKSKGITAKKVCKGTGIHFQRLRSLEQSCIPDCEELIALSEFFSVSVDYILKGVTNE